MESISFHIGPQAWALLVCELSSHMIPDPHGIFSRLRKSARLMLADESRTTELRRRYKIQNKRHLGPE